MPTTPFDLSAYRLPPVHERVTCELPDVNEGLPEPLKIKVRVNPDRLEIMALSQQVSDHFERVGKRTQKQLDAAKKSGKPVKIDPEQERADDIALWDIIAHRVVEWNLQAYRGDELVDVPPPAEVGGAVIELLTTRGKTWLLQIVQSAHMGGDTRSKLSRRPAATASTEAARTPSGPQIVDIPSGETRPSHQKSS